MSMHIPVSPKKNDEDKDDITSKTRPRIARWVILVSFLGLTALAVVTIITAADADRGETAERLLNMMLPLFGTWVGTVIAYYLSGENFDRANKSVDKLVTKITEERLKVVPVTDAMLQLSSIRHLVLPDSEDGSQRNLKSELIDTFRPPITRIPVLNENGHLRFIIHQSMVFRYVTRSTVEEEKPFDAKMQM